MPNPRRTAVLASLALGGLVAREARRTAAIADPAERAQAVRRKLAVATWRAPSEGRLLTRLPIDAGPVQAYVDSRRAAGAKGLTIMHVVGAAAARALNSIPAANARVLGSRIVPMDDVSVGFAVDIGQGTDLAPCKVAGADRLTPAEIANEVWAGVAALRSGSDKGFNTSTRVAACVPGVLMKPLAMATSVVLGGLGLPLLGQQGNPLGSVFVSNLAPLGVEEAFLAAVPFARTPVYISLGVVTDRPVVRDGAVAVVPQFTLCLTGDHRLVDGVQCAIFLDALKRFLADPELLGG
ncbi:MAG TPA: 2-oxo acid dehydrogenase subunit E2 [Mycobacteriales bacterium]|nr:2-oxo acid dehydrogenase subunit E2 [Mycobacteriales bacterium]